MSKALCCAAKSAVKGRGALTFPTCPTKRRFEKIKESCCSVASLYLRLPKQYLRKWFM